MDETPDLLFERFRKTSDPALLARSYAALGTPSKGLEVLTAVAQANRGRRTRASAQP